MLNTYTLTSHAAAISVFTAKSTGIISACNVESPSAKPAPTIKAVDPLRSSTKPRLASLYAGPIIGTRTRATGILGIPSSCNFSDILPRCLNIVDTTAAHVSFGKSWQYSNKVLYGPSAWMITLTFLNNAWSSLLRPRSVYSRLPSNIFTRDVTSGSSCLSRSYL